MVLTELTRAALRQVVTSDQFSDRLSEAGASVFHQGDEYAFSAHVHVETERVTYSPVFHIAADGHCAGAAKWHANLIDSPSDVLDVLTCTIGYESAPLSGYLTSIDDAHEVYGEAVKPISSVGFVCNRVGDSRMLLMQRRFRGRVYDHPVLANELEQAIGTEEIKSAVDRLPLRTLAEQLRVPGYVETAVLGIRWNGWRGRIGDPGSIDKFAYRFDDSTPDH